MTIDLFDVQSGFGGATPGVRQILSPTDLLDEMDRLGVNRALVRILPTTLETDVPGANARLFSGCAGHPQLLPCPVVFPSGGHDLPPEREQVATLICQGAAAVFLRPKADYWSLVPWVSDPLLRSLDERRLPAVCLTAEIAIVEVAELASRHPNLPLIVAGVGYRDDRLLLPLLEKFHNVYLSIGSNYTVHRGIERFVQVVGPRQILFGTGFPAVEMMPAITQLMYADVSDEEKQLIAAGNFSRLLQEIQQ